MRSNTMSNPWVSFNPKQIIQWVTSNMSNSKWVNTGSVSPQNWEKLTRVHGLFQPTKFYLNLMAEKRLDLIGQILHFFWVWIWIWVIRSLAVFNTVHFLMATLATGLKTFSKASNTSSGLSVVISVEDAKIWVACLPNQLINRPALCLSFRSHRGPENKMWQSALNWLNSVNLSFESQSKTGLENCRPPTLDISIQYNTIMTIINTNYI